jgi:hypothetical protein
MNRLDVVQAVIDQRSARNYLEIGVKKGKVFLNVRARKKLAVDPVMKIALKRKIRACLTQPFNLFNEYYELTSDDFFDRQKERLAGLKGLDAVFIDGLHTYGQTWKDVSHSLQFLSPKGVIIMHDCSPATEAQAAPAESRAHAADMHAAPRSDSWSGDVWKTIVRLRSERSDLNVCVLDCDHGVGIIQRGAPEGMLNLTVEAIGAYTYADLENNRAGLLNLKPPERMSSLLLP